MSTIDYKVLFEHFTARHFIKNFSKKYKGAWETTLYFLTEEFKFFDVLFDKNIAETIVNAKDIQICKTEFKIAGSNTSRHGSGNRCIVALHKDTNTVCVLLVYHKNDLSGRNETAEWKNMIKNAYPQYRGLF
jgi:hypothetical protein